MSAEYDEERSAEENQARALFAIADALNGLLYGLKFSKREGMSIEEAIEVAGKDISESLQRVADSAEEAGREVASSVDHLGKEVSP